VTTSVVRERADLVEVLDVLHARATSDTSWARDALESFARITKGAHSFGMHAVEHAPDCKSGKTLVTVRPRGSVLEMKDEHIYDLGPKAVRAFFYPRGLVTSHREIARTASDDVRDRLDDLRRRTGAPDTLGIVVHPEPCVAVVVYALLDRDVAVTRRDRQLLSQLALHFETAFRMRRRPEVVRAVFRGGGALVEGEAGLRAAAHRVERARSAADLGLWPALVNGEVSVVARMRGGRRVYAVVENAPASRQFRALAKREIDVVAMY
jgi:hypothetical protein